jgi:ATP-dependent RNA helicase RhlE
MSFASLGLSEALVRAIEDAGYTEPTPVQQRAIPAVLQGRDLMVAAQTGTGKTGGFALPILERLFPNGHPDKSQRHGPRQPRVLVLTPTRELAAQVHESFKIYARDLKFVSACIFGGVGMNPQVQAMSRGVDVLVACPGRLLDLAGQGSVDLSHVEILVLDEADRMLDMGFVHDVKKVLARLPAKRQNLLFSATFSKDITDLAGKLLHNPERIEVTPPNTTVERIEQRVFRLPASHKRALLAHLITAGAWEQVLVFTRTKHGANRLAEYLDKHGLPPSRSTATRARTPAPKPWPTSRPVKCASWSPPTSPPAAWTSTSCHTWSTSSCRTSTKTTCTVSAVLAVPVVRAKRSRWSRRTKKSCSKASNA